MKKVVVNVLILALAIGASGCYGIILDDTIDGTQDNANYAYEAWAYTAKAEDKPEFKWEGGRQLP